MTKPTDPKFAFECPRSWPSLEPTAEPTVRHCGDCDRPVHLSRDLREAEANSRQGRCVALVPPVRPSIASRFLTSIAAGLRTLTHGKRPLALEQLPDPPPPPSPPRSMKMGMFTLPETPPTPLVGWLVVPDGPHRGRTHVLHRGVNVLGSADTADVRIDDVAVIAAHCKIIETAEGFVLTDGGSPLGTLVMGKRVTTERLVDGDEIWIGVTRLVFKATI